MNLKFYRNIYKSNDKYVLRKGNEHFMTCNTLVEALYERDRFEESDWTWDKYVELPITHNKYEDMDLPVFDKSPSHITKIEYYRVHNKGVTYGTYKTYDEALRRVEELEESDWEG